VLLKKFYHVFDTNSDRKLKLNVAIMKQRDPGKVYISITSDDPTIVFDKEKQVDFDINWFSQLK